MYNTGRERDVLLIDSLLDVTLYYEVDSMKSFFAPGTFNTTYLDYGNILQFFF